MRPIDADAAADKIMHEVEVHADEIGIGAVAIMIAFARALRDETDFPTIEPKRGEWIIKPHGSYGQLRAFCSACGKHSGIGGIESNQRKPFCPNCGAKMDGGADNG